MPPAAEIYRTIDRLPLWRFIDCAVDQDYKALVIEGEATPEELAAAWYSILQDYNDTLGGPGMARRKMLIRGLTHDKVKLDLVLQTIDLLRCYYVPVFAARLNSLLNVNFEYDPDHPQEYDRNLDRALKRCRGLRLEIAIREANLIRLQEENSKGEDTPLTRQYFQGVLISLSDHAGYALTDQITVSEFSERLKRFNNYAEQQASKKTKRRA